MSTDLDTYDRDYYAGQFNRAVFLYRNTRPWRVLHRTVLMGRVRKTAAEFVGVGGQPRMPLSTREEFYNSVSNAWDGWLCALTILLAACAAVIGIIVAIVHFGIFDGSPPKPLPKGIQQRGMSFIIPPNYATTANYEDAHGRDLCSRLPKWNSQYDDFKVVSQHDGSIRIVCTTDD